MSQESESITQRAKVLVADDDMNVRLLSRQCLEAEGMLVVEAAEARIFGASEEQRGQLLEIDSGRTAQENDEAMQAPQSRSSFHRQQPLRQHAWPRPACVVFCHGETELHG